MRPPHSEPYAKRLLRELPDDLTVLLERGKYWDTTFLGFYLDHCDAVLFDRPLDGLELAAYGPELAHLIPQRRPWDWENNTAETVKRRHRELTVRSYAVLGGAHRATGRIDKGTPIYQIAWSHSQRQALTPAAKTDFNNRLAKFRVAQKRMDEAMSLIDEAIKSCPEEDEVALAETLTTKGYILGQIGRHRDAVPYFSQALTLVRPDGKSSSLAGRTFHSAIHNLAAALPRGPSIDDFETAVDYLRLGQRRLSNMRDSVNRYKLFWAEARILAKLGCSRTAARRLVKAYKGLFRLGALRESALVTLELGLLYHQAKLWSKLTEVAREAVDRFRELGQDTEELAAMRLLLEGAKEQSLSYEVLRRTRDRIEKRVAEAKPPRR